MRGIREEEVMSVPSWHQVDPGPVSPDTTTSHAPGQVPRPLAPPPPVMAVCGLCPEPGLVPARHLTDHLDREHPGRAFQCAACKVSLLYCRMSMILIVLSNILLCHKIYSFDAMFPM